MNKTRYENYYDLLRKRRNEIMLTLAHVQKEQRAVDENKDWIDRAAYESRVHLLDNLAEWYVSRIYSRQVAKTQSDGQAVIPSKSEGSKNFAPLRHRSGHASREIFRFLKETLCVLYITIIHSLRGLRKFFVSH